MNSISDFTDAELWTISTTLQERYRKPIEYQLAETELRLDPHSTELTACPAVVWSEGDTHFVVMKVGDRRYRCQFFYRVHQQFGTGIPEFDDLTECVVTLLQVEADHAAKLREEEEKGES